VSRERFAEVLEGVWAKDAVCRVFVFCRSGGLGKWHLVCRMVV